MNAMIHFWINLLCHIYTCSDKNCYKRYGVHYLNRSTPTSKPTVWNMHSLNGSENHSRCLALHVQEKRKRKGANGCKTTQAMEMGVYGPGCIGLEVATGNQKKMAA
jgi:hypothetical protein